MPIRNPFAKRPELNNGFPQNDENANPNATPGFERVDTTGSKASSAISINSKNQEPAEYKLSVVNDSGVYLPPSPPEKKGFWSTRRNPSSTSTNTNPSLAEIEPFSISRESFDSYRRSFDISAKSPVMGAENMSGRQSLDSARLPRLPRSAINERRFERQPPTAEEGFEDVGLNDEQKQKEAPKKKSFFSKFGESEDGTSRFNVMGRKRGQSGQGAELGSIDRPDTANSKDAQEVR